LSELESSFVKNLSAESLNQRIMSEVIELVSQLSRSSKYIFVFEDIHWIDPQSKLLLKMLIEEVKYGNFQIVLLSRTDHYRFVKDMLEEVELESEKMKEIHLERLSPDESRELAANFPDYNKFQPKIIDQVVEITEGNPFFLQEMLRAMVDSISSEVGNGQSTSVSNETIKIPQSIQAAILSRVDRLSARTKSVLQTAVVLGRTFGLDLLKEMLVTSLPIDHVEESLKILLQRKFISLHEVQDQVDHQLDIFQKNKSSNLSMDLDICFKKPEKYALYFTHAITQEVVYGTLLYSKRRQLHTMTGKALEVIHKTDRDRNATLLAFHYDHGLHPEKAIPFYAVKAKQAIDVFSLKTAYDAYSRALELLLEMSGEQDRIMLAVLHEGLGDVHFLRSEYSEALESFDKALEIKLQSRNCNELQFKKGKLLQKWGKYDEAKISLENAIDCMKDDYDENLAGKIYTYLSLIYYHTDNLEIAVELGNLALLLEKNTNDLIGISQACNNLGVILTKSGDWKSADNYFDECIKIGIEITDSYGMAACYNNWGLLAIEQENWDKAIERFEKGRDLFDFLDNKHGLARVFDNMSKVYYSKDDQEMAEEMLVKAVSILAEISTRGEKVEAEMWQSGAW